MTKYYLYKLFDAEGALLYVGASCQPSMRFMHHGRLTEWFHLTRFVIIRKYRTQKSLLAAERKSIKKQNPQFNIRSAVVHDVKRRSILDQPKRYKLT